MAQNGASDTGKGENSGERAAAGGHEASGLKRREAMATVAAATGVGLAGCASGQTQAVNVEDPPSLSNVEDVEFDTDGSAGWLVERVIEDPTGENVAVGREVEIAGRILARFADESTRTDRAETFAWDDFGAGADKIGPLFEAIDWTTTPQPRATETFYDDHQLVLVAGTSGADQRFYNKYGIVPVVPLRVSADIAPQVGTAVRATATVRWSSDNSKQFRDGVEGVYLAAKTVDRRGGASQLSEETAGGDEVRLVGIQSADSRRLAALGTTVDYEYETEFPAAGGGSLVLQEGAVTAADLSDEPPVGQLALTTRDQQVLTGDTVPGLDRGAGGSEGDGDSETGDSSEGERANVVAVVDTSGSMDESDARDGQRRIVVARESARALVSFVERGNRLGVVGFDTGARVREPLTAVEGPGIRDGLNDAIDGLGAGGDTSITAGLRAAIERLRTADGSRAVVLLSDGRHNTGRSPTALIPELKSLGITVYSIGMGSADRALLRRLTRATGGRSAFAPQPGEIRALYQEFSVAAQRRATLASQTATLSEGEAMTQQVTVDSSCDDVQFSLSYPGSTITLTPRRPDGETLDEGASDVTHRVTDTSEVWTVAEPATGDWEYELVGDDLDRAERARVEVNAASPVRTTLFVSDALYDETGLYKVELRARQGRERYTGGEVTLTARPPTAGAGETADAEATETSDDGDGGSGDSRGKTTIRLSDSGGGPDPVSGDGIYTGYFHPEREGEYEFTVRLEGGGVGGLSREFTRRVTAPEAVDEPAAPYRSADRGSGLSVGGRGLPGGGLLAEWGPLLGFVTALGLIAVYVWRGMTTPGPPTGSDGDNDD